MISFGGLYLALLALSCTGVTGAGIQRICSFYESGNMHSDSASDGYSAEDYDYKDTISTIVQDDPLSDGESMVCGRNEEYCYALWSFDSNQNVTMKRQGCWSISDTHSACDNSDCIAEFNPATNEKFLFCCCTSNLCNSRVTWKVITGPTTTTELPPSNRHDFSVLLLDPVVWITLAIAFLILLTLILIAILRKSRDSYQKPRTSGTTPPDQGFSSNLHNVDNLKLVSLLGQGKYGTVWKGILNESSVAVKIFPGGNKQFFLNEKDIYSLPLMDHKSLLVYFGSDERLTIDGRTEYLLVLSLAPVGCLQDFLRDTTTSFSTFCKMAVTIAQGLSHLHCAIRKGNLTKPSICHRDLNTRNILVKSDMTCCLCDFGFSLKCYGPRYEYRGQMTLAETKSIIEVGTLRYMAPEVLEGAVNLKDCEAALKQIDVYALGLIIWELATRCHDFYFNEDVPGYSAPYEAIVGNRPTYEQMQIVVSRQKMRPSFASNWGLGAASKLIRDTCEDCWDGDSEARLTTLCVEERIKELMREKQTISLGDPNLVLNQAIDIRSTTKQSLLHSNDPTNRPIPDTGNHTKYFCPTTMSNELASKGSSVKSMRKDKSAFRLPGKKLKRYKVDKTFHGWHGVSSMIQKKLFKRMKLENDDAITDKWQPSEASATPTTTAIRPTNLNIVPQRFYPTPRICGAFGETTTETTDGECTRDRARSKLIKESAKLDKKITNPRLSLQPVTDWGSSPGKYSRPRIVVSKSANTMRQMDVAIEKNLKRQRSLEVFRDVFSTQQSTDRLRDPSQRVKTPGDVPPSVRKTRACKTLSLYDDRMMGWDNTGHTM